MLSHETRAMVRLSAIFSLILVALSIVLIAFRIEQVLLEFAQSRGVRAAHQVREQIEGGIRLGLTLSDQTHMAQWLKRQHSQESALAGARVQSESGETIASEGSEAAFDQLNPVWTAQLLRATDPAGKHQAVVNAIARRLGSMAYIGVPVADAAGRPIAVVWLAFDRTALEQSALSILRVLWPSAAFAVVLLAFSLALLARLWLRGARNRLETTAQVFLTDSGSVVTAGLPLQQTQAVDKALAQAHATWRKPLLPLCAGVLVLGVLLALAWQAREVARPLLLTQIDQNSRTVLDSAKGHIERALSLGVPADQLVGVDAMFATELQPAAEIEFLALRSSHGSLDAFSPGSSSTPERSRQAQNWLEQHEQHEQQQGQVRSSSAVFRTATAPLTRRDGEKFGELLIGTSLNYVDERIRSMLLDLLLAVVVSWVLMRELLGALWQRAVLKPYLVFENAWPAWRLRAQRLALQSGTTAVTAAQVWRTEVQASIRQLAGNRTGSALPLPTAQNRYLAALVRIRLMVFFTALSEELLRPIFAVFASETSPPLANTVLSPTLLAGLPVAAFMLTLALAQPLGPWIARQVQTRKALCAGAVLGAVLMAATAWVQSGLLLMALRAGSGVVYGLMLILSQTAIVHLSPAGQRARGLVEVSAAIVAAGVCGPALGGLLAERLGAPATLLACAVCLTGAAFVSLSLPNLPRTQAGDAPSGLGGWRGVAAVMSNPKVLAVIVFAAIPARLAAAALLVVLTPLYLLEIGETGAVTGRVLLLYFVAFMLTAPLVAHRSDLSGQRRPWIVAGCSLSALACASLPLVGGVAGAALCCALLGMGQALLSAPMVALVTEAFDPIAADDRMAVAANVGQLAVTASPAQALAAFRFIERLGSILAPFAVALAVASWGLSGAAGVLGAGLALGAVAVALAMARFSNVRESAHAAP